MKHESFFDQLPSPVLGSHLVTLLLMLLTGLTGCYSPSEESVEPIEELRVRLVGKDYRLYFQYPGRDLILDTEDDRYGRRDLHVPQDAVVRLQLDSRDYIYTIEIPELELYEVAVPDLAFEVEFTATVAGDYELLGSQMCGYDHPGLLGRFRVQPAPDYRDTIRGLPRSSLQDTDVQSVE